MKRNKRSPSGDALSPPAHEPLPEGVELLYGLHTVAEALRNPRRRIQALLITANAARRLAPEIEALRASGIEPEIVHPSRIEKITGPEAVHQGVALLAEPLPRPFLHEIAREGTVVLLDQVTDPHNVGAILRSSCAFGVHAVITTARHAPRLTPVLAKAASGALEHVALVQVTNLARAMDELKDYGFTIYGLDSEAEGVLDCSLPVSGAVALVLGAEGKGLRHKTRAHCDALLRLDAPGPIRSLNVSNAAAIALFALDQARRNRASPSSAGTA
ncbi:23S rRNA (guanosine(2251)-2'-O)-methyltransferase RlmB [Thermopetrobacter sp. TC1]|uniref:23S rRNA (guanosine(2251)-2'-O)-methyltransferase RlmB n=1 Tax=Thermopetrobacter sp. TC1 TaxID=1495045 RepID=UPI0009DFAD83|nr:23S rRNA (guanosine(2251)-2'-O)-methyltransferase RlmB [Thermopetrobacter sp. TC1]